MRFLEVTVHLYDQKQAEITGLGEDDHTNDVPKRCCIDLDEVMSWYEAKTEGINVVMKSGESFWLKNTSFDMFKSAIEGTPRLSRIKVNMN